MMKNRVWASVVILSVFCASPSNAAEKVIRLYEGSAPGSEEWKQKEAESSSNFLQTRVVYNVVNPTLTVFEPTADKSVGTAVVICPGGGFHFLAIDHEGTEVARALADQGITCFVLKYRLVECKTSDPVGELMGRINELEKYFGDVPELATADGLAAIGYVRQHAAEYGIKPDRIGIMGFSAGGMVAWSAAYAYAKETRPDFVVPIYAPWEKDANRRVPGDAPPILIIGATDDQLDLGPQSVMLYQEWVAAKKSAELHMFAQGGHGFGMRKQNLPVDHWIDRFTDWLGARGMLGK